MTDQEYAAAIAEALNRHTPHSHWVFSAKIDICNCSKCKNVVLVLLLDTNGDLQKPLSQVYELTDVKRDYGTRFDDFAEFTIGNPIKDVEQMISDSAEDDGRAGGETG